MSRRLAISFAVVFLLALVFRAGHVASLLGSPVGDTPVLDARHYHAEALRLVGVLPPSAAGPSFMNVGYPYALAAVYALSGTVPAHMLWVQALLGASSALFLALAAKHLTGSSGAGLLAGVLYAVYAGSIYYDGLLLTPSLVNACLALALWLLSRVSGTIGLGSIAAAGVAVGFTVVLRANMLLLVPLWAAVLAIAGGAGRRRLRGPSVFAAAALALPLGIVLWNGAVHGAWVPVSANGGMNFWVGNHRDAVGTYRAAPFVANQDAGGELEGFLEEARLRSGRPDLTLAESSGFWFRETLGEIRAAPGEAVARFARKLAMFWSRTDGKTNVGRPFVAGLSPWLRFAPVGFGLLSIVGVAGLALLSRAGRREAVLVGSLVCVPLFTCTLFFVSGEYRHPASLALCVAAAWFLSRLAGDRRLAPGAVAAAILAAVLALWPHPALEAGTDPNVDAWNFVRRLTSASAEGQPPTATDLKNAAALADRPPLVAHTDLFVLDARLRAHTRAAVGLRDPRHVAAAIAAAREIRAREIRPDMPGYFERFAHHLRASLRDHLGELSRLEFVRADAETSRELALLGADRWRELDELMERKDFEAAESFLQEALLRAPHEPRLHAAMGTVLLSRGREPEGLERLERSCAGWPEVPECAYTLAQYRLRRGDLERAREAAREALRRDPGFTPAAALLHDLDGDPSVP